MFSYTIPASQSELWNKLANFKFDEPGTERTFQRRLIEQTGWNASMASQAIEEYRKFLFLSAVVGHIVTPSKVVDEVWHLHLQDTRSYWLELCLNVLQRPLHHMPSKGGRREDKKYEDAYEQTLNSYERYFGMPNSELWGHSTWFKKRAAKGAAIVGTPVESSLYAGSCGNDALMFMMDNSTLPSEMEFGNGHGAHHSFSESGHGHGHDAYSVDSHSHHSSHSDVSHSGGDGGGHSCGGGSCGGGSCSGGSCGGGGCGGGCGGS